MLYMTIDWATKEEPQKMAVMRSKTIPIGLVQRIVVLFYSIKV